MWENFSISHNTRTQPSSKLNIGRNKRKNFSILHSWSMTFALTRCNDGTKLNGFKRGWVLSMAASHHGSVQTPLAAPVFLLVEFPSGERTAACKSCMCASHRHLWLGCWSSCDFRCSYVMSPHGTAQLMRWRFDAAAVPPHSESESHGFSVKSSFPLIHFPVLLELLRVFLGDHPTPTFNALVLVTQESPFL